MTDLLSVVSVDVLCLSFDPAAEHIRLGLVRRDSEPYAGEQALPGVTMRAGERLDGPRSFRDGVTSMDEFVGLVQGRKAALQLLCKGAERRVFPRR